MSGPLNEAEMRFLLAEIIKNSQMDVGALGHFVMANGVEPNWLQMQLPFGRNMNQCIEVTDAFGIKKVPWLKRKTSDDQGGPAAKRMASQTASQQQKQGNQEQAPNVAVASTHKAILPRPPSNSEESTPAPAPPPPPPAPTGPKKKGRPARADRAKLHANLPPKIAPRPPPVEPSTEANNEPVNQAEKQPPQATSQASEAPAAQPKKPARGRGKAKTPAPASTPASQNQEPADPPPMSNYITTFPSVPPGGFQNDTAAPVHDESAEPRVMVEATEEEFENPRLTMLSNMPILPPLPQMGTGLAHADNAAAEASLNEEPTTLAPMLGSSSVLDQPQEDPVANPI